MKIKDTNKKIFGKTIYMYITKQSDYNMLKFIFPPGFRLDVVRKQTGSNSADKHQQ